MREILEWILWFYREWPIFGGLVALMFADVATGACAAAYIGELNSAISLRGCTRKFQIVIACGIAKIMEPHAQGLPLLNITAGFYIYHEMVSISENIRDTGVPLPKWFDEWLAKRRDEEELRIPAQTIVIKRPKRPSDFVELGTGPPKKESGESPVVDTDDPP